MTKPIILFLSANRPDPVRMTLAEESCSLYRARNRRHFDLVTRWSMRPSDLVRDLRELQPTVLHLFCRDDWKGLCPEDAHRQPPGVFTADLAEMLGAAGSSVKLVLLSACSTAAHAKALAAHIDCVIAMDGANGDAAAQEFALGFYGALGERASVAAAFQQGVAAFHRGLAILEPGTDNARPRLEVRDGVDATRVVLATRPASSTAASAAAGNPTSLAIATTATTRATASADGRCMDADGDVWDLLCKGERAQALQLLMQRYGRDVHRFCHKLLGDETLADDVHQQVFLSAYHDLPHFAGRSTMRTWLLSIARHRSIDALRCRARQESRQADLAEVAGISDPRPLAIESLGRTQLLTTALDSLEEPARQALLLRYQRGLSFEEMARICDQRPAVLRMRVSRALRRLREAMQACAKRFSAPALHQRKLGTTSARCSAAVDAAMPIAAVA